MSLTDITINTVAYKSYASRAEANVVLSIDPVRMAAWNALADDDNSRGPYLVAATNRLDLLTWQGEKTGGEGVQANQWPRTGLTYKDGTAVTTTDVPLELERATILLAGSILLSSKVAEAGSSGSNTKSVKAGSAEVQFFRAQEGKVLQDESAFGLIQQWLEAASLSASLGQLASGGEGCSSFEGTPFGRFRGFP